MPHAVGPVTAEELARFPDDDHRYELVQGRVIRMNPTSVGFKLESQPDTVRAPDLAFIRHRREAAAGRPSVRAQRLQRVG